MANFPRPFARSFVRPFVRSFVRTSAANYLPPLRAAMASATHFMVTGDSTRDNSTNRMMSFYIPYMLGKAGIMAIDNAVSGLSAEDWGDNTGTITSADAIADIPGDGSNVVWSFSLGINDVDSTPTQTAQQVFDFCTPGIDAVLAAKPNIHLFFVQPVAVANSARNDVLNEAYQMLGEHYEAHVVGLYQPMRDVYDGTGALIFYADGTHPSIPGSMRAFNYVLSEILADSQLASVLLDDRHYTGWTESLVLALDNTDLIDGKYWNSSGTRSNNASWKSFDLIQGVNGQMLKVTHGGNRDDIRALVNPPDADGGNLERQINDADRNPSAGVYEYDLAGTVTDIGVNVDSTGGYTIDPGDKAEIFNLTMVKQPSDLPQAEINVGLTLRLSEYTPPPVSGDLEMDGDPMEWNADQLIFNAA